MKQIGFLGCGKIGKALAEHVLKQKSAGIVFIQDPGFVNDLDLTCPVLQKADEALYQKVDLIIECATAGVLSEHLEFILRYADLMMFSVTAFSDEAFEKRALELCWKYGRRIYIPHGAILGLDGIFDGRRVWREVSIETVKSPQSLGLGTAERGVVYEGATRGACRLFPRNVNVHAAVALAGLGFDRTESRIVADPAVSTNAHTISLKGDSMEITLQVSSFAAGAVTGAYTPHSACGSLDRVLGADSGRIFV